MRKAIKPEKAMTPAVAMRERIIRRAALEFKDGMYGILCFIAYIHSFIAHSFIAIYLHLI